MNGDTMKRLSDAQLERLTILQEECAEVIHIIAKIKRFGFDDVKPGASHTNRQRAEIEIGQLQNIIQMCVLADDFRQIPIMAAQEHKRDTIGAWLNYQDGKDMSHGTK